MFTRYSDEEMDLAYRDGDVREGTDAGDGWPLILYPSPYYGPQGGLYATNIR
jgi:hypothetical protein